jgi:hypothetical protein
MKAEQIVKTKLTVKNSDIAEKNSLIQQLLEKNQQLRQLQEQ